MERFRLSIDSKNPPADFGIERTQLRIPTSAVPWPRKAERPRTAAISGFGFGGTNAHLIVEDYVPGSAAPATPQPWKERLAIVGWATHLPGLTDRDQASSWFENVGDGPAVSFGGTYPLPPFDKVRMPPGVLRAI